MNEQEENSPIILFTYNRLLELKKTIAQLQNAYISEDSLLYIYSDGAKSKSDENDVHAVREYLKSVNGFKNIHLNFSEQNKGLAASIIDGVTTVCKKHGKVIVLEDDLEVSKNFLVFMNEALKFYEGYKSVSSICGYNITSKIRKSNNYQFDIYFGKRSSSWGWATWYRQWKDIDWQIEDFNSFSKNKGRIREFNSWGSDMFGMLKKQQKGEISSWAIRYSYHQYKNALFSVFPINSKVRNIGFNERATHTRQKLSRFANSLDNTDNKIFNFNPDVVVNEKFAKEFRNVNSIYNRIKGKLLNLVYI